MFDAGKRLIEVIKEIMPEDRNDTVKFSSEILNKSIGTIYNWTNRQTFTNTIKNGLYPLKKYNVNLEYFNEVNPADEIFIKEGENGESEISLLKQILEMQRKILQQLNNP